MFLSRNYNYFLFKLLCLPRQLLIPKVDNNCPESWRVSELKLWPYKDRNMSLFGDANSFSGLLPIFLFFLTSVTLRGLLRNLFLGSSGWMMRARWRSKFWVILLIHEVVVQWVLVDQLTNHSYLNQFLWWRNVQCWVVVGIRVIDLMFLLDILLVFEYLKGSSYLSCSLIVIFLWRRERNDFLMSALNKYNPHTISSFVITFVMTN